MNGKIYEFGLKKLPRSHEDRLDALLEFVRKHNITYIIDVRTNLGNQYTNWNCRGFNIGQTFNKIPSVHYQWYQELGGKWRESSAGRGSKYYQQPARWNNYKQAYIKRISGPICSPTIQRLFDIIRRGNNIVLLCLERDGQCHRFILKEYLERWLE